MANNWDEFFSTPVKASKKLHVTPQDVRVGAKIDARRREAERVVAEQNRTVPTGFPYGVTPRPSGVPSDAPRMYEGDNTKTPRPDLISNALLAGTLGGGMSAFGLPSVGLRAGLIGGGAIDAVLNAPNSEGGSEISGGLAAAGVLGRRALPAALAAGAAYAADADAMPVAKYLRGSLPTSIYGKGWFYNHANDTLAGIPPGDLGPHGDHDGWVGIAKNAKALGIDPKLSKIIQRQYGFFLPRDITKIAMELGWDPQLERGRGFYTPGQEFSISDEANTFLEDYYKKIHGISPGESWTAGAEVGDTLTRIRAWPGRKGSPYISGLSFTEKPVTPSQFRNIWDDIGPELQADKASTFNMYDDAGGLLTLPISEALTAKRWPINKAAGGSVKKMLQGVYRGYAGERRPTIGALGSEMYFTSPQKRVADYYATRRAAETGEAPHVDMLMVDPFNTKYQSYSLGLPADKYNPSRDAVVTRARRVDPEEVIDTHQLYAGGGLVKSGLKMMFPNLGAPLHVVKPKGGNWLSGSVEDALKGLKKDEPNSDATWAALPRDLIDKYWHSSGPHQLVQKTHPKEWAAAQQSLQPPINNWIEGPLTKYVKTRMASPEDEVRRLADEGVLHFEPRGIRDQSPIMRDVVEARTQGGFAPQGYANSPLGDQWEKYADSAIDPRKVRDFTGDQRTIYEPGNEWMKKAPPDTPVYRTDPNNIGTRAVENLGFDHLIDELSNALDAGKFQANMEKNAAKLRASGVPEEEIAAMMGTPGLPRHLQLTPEAVKNLSMEKAVRRVADINAWRAAQKVEANRALAEQAALVREYADDSLPNPKGLRWVELKKQEALPEGWSLKPGEGEYAGYDWFFDPQGKAHNKLNDPRNKLLEDQLKYEGDTMGHCVGGYCDDVISGRSRIFSLRDAKGEPHVTVEVDPSSNIKDHAKGILDPENPEQTMHERIMNERMGNGDYEPFAKQLYDKLGLTTPPPRIIQIKGKQNRKPNDEYLPFVQDFVRSGQWSEVGDLQNAGLRRTIDAFNSNELKKIQEAGIEVPVYATPEEIKAIGQQVWPDDWGKYAQGGSVAAPAAGWDILTDPTPAPEQNKSPWDIFSGHNDSEQLEAVQ